MYRVDWCCVTSRVLLPIVVLISGNGTNLQAIIDAIHDGQLRVEIRAVISNCDDAFGLVRAQRAGIPTQVISHRDFKSRHEFDMALQTAIDTYTPKLICLAGFMRRLGARFVQHYQKKIINIHPSLLPRYPGLDTHRRVLEAGDEEHGATIHWVTEGLDTGPVISRVKTRVLPHDTVETLQRRVQDLEHGLYVATLQRFAEGVLEV